MATGTRSKDSLEESIKKTDFQVQELMNSHYHLQQTVDELGTGFKNGQSTMELMMTQFQQFIKGKDSDLGNNNEPVIELGQTDGRNVENVVQRNFHPKFDFPVFNGLDMKNWIMKCEYFFQFHPMNYILRLRSVALHLEGEAGSWFLTYFKNNPNVSWKQFIEDVETRFGDSVSSNALAEFNRLQQSTTVSHYQKKFEFLRALVQLENQGLDEAYFVKCFVGGLKEEIGGFVGLLKPKKLTEAIAAARVQEMTVEAIYKRSKHTPQLHKTIANSGENHTAGFNNRTFKPKFQSSGDIQVGNSHIAGGLHKDGMGNHVKRLTFGEMQARKEKGLCFNCDELFTQGHRCKFKQLYLITGDDEWEEEVNDEAVSTEPVDMIDHQTETEMAISIHALNGNTSETTLRIKASVQGKQIIILIDTGSTHNFLNSDTASRLHCTKEVDKPMQVCVADGYKMICNERCKKFEWGTQGHKFCTDMRLIPLKGCNAVLGVQWLKTLGDCMFNFNTLTLSFSVGKDKIMLKGTSDGHQNSVAMITAVSLQEAWRKEQLSLLAYVCAIQGQELNNPQHPPQIQQVLHTFEDVFNEPKTLPPQRDFDHKIPVKVGSEPFTIRPYRYPHIQKTEIKKIVKEMLEAGIIQPSQSPFASPVLLVKKKDGSWRFCVDYRELNKMTVKDKFPIPIIEELLDELKGSTIFSKLDLRAGYHQIRMNSDDVSKTAFRTHVGHYEFLVMPFGLTNAPASFQALMNKVFSAHLRKFILVFFDDILVYSSDLSSHVKHLEVTLALLRQHTLFAKLSKCSFAQNKVEYLGHIITAEGVSADPSKIACMLKWPEPTTVKGLRGFLGLTGYYRRFIRKYGEIARPLTTLYKRINSNGLMKQQKLFTN